MSSDATFIKHAEFDIKYSRLSRLLRLSNLKNWLIGQAEKRGIRVHVTHAAYSSQECPKCHHISRKNRKVQETFCCEECKFTAPADNVAGTNLKRRFVSDVLRPALHDFDDYGRMVPKQMRRSSVKLILSAQHKSSKSVGRLTDLHSPALTKKDAVATSRLIEAPSKC